MTRILTALAIFATGAANATTIAHWNFNSEADFNNGVISDVSGNGNSLYMYSSASVPAENTASYSTESLDLPAGNSGSIRFNGTRVPGHAGEYFQTIDGAAMNGLTFDNGYTVEVIFKPETPFNPDENRWMGMLSRTGRAGGDSPATFAISNLGEIQWQTTEWDDIRPGRSEAAWSPVIYTPGASFDPGFIHVAGVNYQDGSGDWHVDMYVNGVLQTRNITNADHNGLASYNGSLWNVGANMWDNNVEGYFNGWIDDVRISDVALAPSQFTLNVPEPGAVLLAALGLIGVATRR